MTEKLSKLTKAKLIERIGEMEEQLDYLSQKVEYLEDTKYDEFKTELGLTYHTDEEWINYIKRIQDLNAERLRDCNELTNILKQMNNQRRII
tara:strand:+ start:409 stop:684 length:276 start_codon:yes stop_codon:yes gene_type:complete